MNAKSLYFLLFSASLLHAQSAADKTAYEVTFQNNTKTSTSYTVPYAQGGGLSSQTPLEITRYSNVALQNNSTISTKTLEAGSSVGNRLEADAYSYGGAIYSTESVHITNNTNVDFSNNYAQSSTSAKTIKGYTAEAFSYSAGGAIYSTSNIELLNNGTVTFCNNYVDASSYAAATGSTTASGVDFGSSAQGAAIFTTGTLNISGNSSVLFEKNYEKTKEGNADTVYLLRSIHLESADELTLSAKNKGDITIYDSLYMKHKTNAIVSLNADFKDVDGVTQKATGDIIFSGKYTADHLKEIKGGIAGTDTEISNSQTSALLNTVTLHAGTLRVEDKAVLKTQELNVAANGDATVRITDATINAGAYSVNVNNTGTLILGGTNGSSKLTALNTDIRKGATLSVENTTSDTRAVITLTGPDSESCFNEKLGGTVSGNLNMAAGSTYKADGAHLSVTNGALTLNATSDTKINLVLTLLAQYEEDSKVMLFTDVNTVEFILDNLSTSKNGIAISLNAADYFCGDWINESTALVYDGSSVYVTGVNRVIPEPATATMTWLALAALAARRRRRG